MTSNREDKRKSIITSKDLLILKELFEDGRESSSSISKKIDLGREVVNYRIKRLIKENLIVKFVPKVNKKILHYQEYIILLKLNLEDELSKEKFIREKIGNKYLVWFIKSNEGWDLIVRLYASGVDEFKKKLSEILDMFSNVLADYYTIISSEEIADKEKKLLVEQLFNKNFVDDFKQIKQIDLTDVSIDEKDRQIISMLEEDARVQYKEIAEKLDISSDTVKYRIDKMKSMGVIENFTPIINLSKLGFYQYVSIIRFKFLNEEEEKKIVDYFKSKNEVMRVIKNLNQEEYFINLVFDKKDDIDSFKKQIQNILPNKLDSIEIFNID